MMCEGVPQDMRRTADDDGQRKPAYVAQRILYGETPIGSSSRLHPARTDITQKLFTDGFKKRIQQKTSRETIANDSPRRMGNVICRNGEEHWKVRNDRPNGQRDQRQPFGHAEYRQNRDNMCWRKWHSCDERSPPIVILSFLVFMHTF